MKENSSKYFCFVKVGELPKLISRFQTVNVKNKVAERGGLQR